MTEQMSLTAGAPGGVGPDYIETGVRLVAAALGCCSADLIEQAPASCRDGSWSTRPLRVASWPPTAQHAIEDADLLALARGLVGSVQTPRPGVALVVATRCEDAVTGWRLEWAPGGPQPGLDVVPRLMPIMADPLMRRDRDLCDLTQREIEVLDLVGLGLTSSAIARRCGISTRTVHKHLEKAYRKLHCHDRVSAVLRVRQQQLATA